MFKRSLAMAFGMAIAVAAPRAQAVEFQLPDPNDYCATPHVIENIKRDIDHKFRAYTKRKIFALEIINPSEAHSRDRDETHTVARKWCHGKLRSTDGKIRDMWYLLEKPWGMAGIPVLSSTEFCIAGLDPWKIYGKDCSTIRNTIGW